jgi:histone deacetylase 11
MKEVIPIVYSEGYNISAFGFEKLHPFDTTKYKRIWQFLFELETLKETSSSKIYHYPKELPSRKWLLEVMDPIYLAKLNYSYFICQCIDMPMWFLPSFGLRSQLLEPMMLATKGSVEAAYLAMNKGWAINLSGGYHHASRDEGSGFCIYPDIKFITHFLRKYYKANMKILIVDLDAH